MALFFQSFLVWLESSKYVLLFLGTMPEGPVIMLTSGFLFRIGQLDFLPMFIALVLGDFVSDVGWYCLGRFGTRKTIFKFGYIINLTPKILEKIEGRFLKYHKKYLIISKLTMGIGFAAVVLIVAGMFKVPFKNFVIINLLGGMIWTSCLIVIGYFFGNIYANIYGPTKIIFAITSLMIAILGIYLINNYLLKKQV